MLKAGSIIRLTKAARVFLKTGILAQLPFPNPKQFPANFINYFSAGGRQPNRIQALQEIAKLGPSYIKLGQFLSIRPDLIGVSLAHNLSYLQDRMPFFSKELAIAQIETNLEDQASNLFLTIDEAVAAASIAQVHPGTVLDDDGNVNKVAIKVIRPNIRANFRRDLQDFYFAANLIEKYSSEGKRLKPTSIVQLLDTHTTIEMDLRLEAAAIAEMAENIKQDKYFKVPKVDWKRTSRDILTLEWVDGVKISDLESLRSKNIDCAKLANNLMQSFLLHVLRDGFFHADMHPGNLLVNNNGDIVAIDFGIMGRLTLREREFLAEILYGFISRDYLRVAKAHIEAGYVPNKHDIYSFAQAIRAIGEPIHGQTAQNISIGRLLGLLFEITALFNMQTRPELLMLQKTMVVVEGVCRNLDPNFNLWESSEPIVKEWLQKNLGVGAKLQKFSNGVSELSNALLALPDIINQQPSKKDYQLMLQQRQIEQTATTNKWISRCFYLAILVLIVIAFKS